MSVWNCGRKRNNNKSDIEEGCRRLANKGVLVTGANSGIGKAIARRFAQEGATVIVSDLNADGVNRVVGEIESSGGSAYDIVQDITDEKARDTTVETILEKHK